MTVGIKKRVSDALEDAEGRLMTMGEVMRAADIDKRLANEVSSALYKLRNQGLIETVTGPTTAVMGRRLVRMYRWVDPSTPRPQKTAAGASVTVVAAATTVRRVFNF